MIVRLSYCFLKIGTDLSRTDDFVGQISGNEKKNTYTQIKIED